MLMPTVRCLLSEPTGSAGLSLLHCRRQMPQDQQVQGQGSALTPLRLYCSALFELEAGSAWVSDFSCFLGGRLPHFVTLPAETSESIADRLYWQGCATRNWVARLPVDGGFLARVVVPDQLPCCWLFSMRIRNRGWKTVMRGTGFSP